MKSGKEVTISAENKNFKVRLGAVIKYKEPKTIYLKITSWLRVKNKVTDLNSLLKEYRIAIKSYLKSNQLVLDHFGYDTIIDIDISKSRVKLDRPTFFTLELNLRQRNENKLLPLVQPKRLNVPNLKPVCQKITDDILNLELFTNHKHFIYQYKKLEHENEETDIGILH